MNKEINNKSDNSVNKVVEIDGFEFIFNDDDILVLEEIKKQLSEKYDNSSENI